MNVIEFINQLQTRDIKLAVEDGKLKINAPEGALDDETISKLKDFKQEIIEFLQAANFEKTSSITRVEREKFMPLSFAQQRLWFLDRLSSDSRYNMSGNIEITGNLDIENLRKTFEFIVAKHEILRTTFVEHDGDSRQVIHEPEKWEMPLIDLCHLEGEELSEKKKNCIRSHAERLFDLGKSPLFRTSLLKTEESHYTLMIAMHHIISDEWSIGIMVNEITSIYAALIKNDSEALQSITSNLDYQYVDFAVWQKNLIKNDEGYQSKLKFWREYLENLTVLEVPTDFIRQASPESTGKNYYFKVTEKQKQKLFTLSKNNGVTVYAILLASYKVLLQRYSGVNDVCVGVPFANREQPEQERIIGFFVNSLPIRSQVGEDLEFINFVKKVQESLLEADLNQAVPFEQIVAEVVDKRDLSHSPVFQTMFSFQNEPSMKDLKLDDLNLEFNTEENSAAKFDFSLYLENESSGMLGIWEYNAELFEPETASRMADHFMTILDQAINNPSQKIQDFTLPFQQEECIFGESSNNKPAKIGSTVVQRFIEQANDLPGKLAIEFNGQQMNYGELHIASNALANLLITNEVGLGSRVIVFMERSIESVISLLAILKTGASYIPIDSSYPEGRVQTIIDDAKPDFIISQSHLLTGKSFLDFDSNGNIFCFDKDNGNLKQLDIKTPNQVVRESDEAYVIYTSGSTGEPKGVRIPHSGLSNLIEWHLQYYKVSQDSRASQLAGFSFDACVWEIWPYLCAGSSLHIVDDVSRTNAKEIIRWLAQNYITHSFLPTPLAEAVLSEPLPGNWALKYLLTGGDRLTSRPEENERFKLFNNYGPTECSVVSTVAEVKSGDIKKLPSIGKPISNVKCYVLDKNLKPLPDGMVGELYIGGEGLALGYINNKKLTEKAFIQNPFDKGKLYKTGDLVRRLLNGELDYWGRVDQQVQIRGFRVEVGEIEAFLHGCDEINESAVIPKGEGSNKFLVAYVVPNAHVLRNKKINLDKIKAKTREHLPEYMVPSFFIELKEIPVTVNGKVDRKRLPEIDIGEKLVKNFVPPKTRTEKIIAGMWRNLLEVKKVGIHDNFFDLGGHSLIATQIIARIRESFNIDLPLKLLFEGYDISELSKKVENAVQNKPRDTLPALTSVDRTSVNPVSFAQKRMWVLDKLETGDSAFNAGAAYNISAGLFIEGELNLEALNRAFDELIKRHEILRTTFVTKDGELYQEVLEPYKWVTGIEDLSDLSDKEIKQKLRNIAHREAIRSFDLEAGENARRTRLLRTILVKTETNKNYLFTTMHHIISDGWSMNILIKELEYLYNAIVKNEPLLLPPLSVQYADFTIWQKKILQGDFYNKQISYWKDNLYGLEKTELPIDRSRPALQSFKGDEYVFNLPSETTDKVIVLAKTLGVTPFMIYLSVFKCLIHRYNGQHDICVGTPIANRTHARQEEIIGFFANSLALRTDLSGDPGFKSVLKRVQETTMGAYSHQEIPFEKLVDELNVERDLSRTPIFQIFFSMVEKNVANINLDELNVSLYENKTTTSQFDLTLNIEETDDELSGRIIFNTDLFNAETIEGIANHYRNMLVDSISNTDKKISQLSMLNVEEQEHILYSLSGYENEKKYPPIDNILEIFEKQASETPGNIAVKFKNREISYLELNNKANQLAHYLVEQGLKPGQIVALCQERSLELLISIYGILKAGGAYTPLGPDYPQGRLEFVLKDTKAAFLITDKVNKLRFGKTKTPVICTSDFDQCLIGLPETNTECQRSRNHICYVIYTSGSTGKPKGVVIQHAGLINRLQWMQETYCLDETDRVLQKTPYSFDVSVWEFFWPLMTGASIVMAEPGGHKDPAYLKQIIKEEKITTLHFVPSMLSVYLDNIEEKQSSSLKRVICSGEALSKPLESRFFELVDAELHNLYGPTEASIDVSYWQCKPDESSYQSVPIGYPIANMQLYILDKYLNPVPVGVPGELHIAGVGLAKEYLGRPELTEEKFIPKPFSDQGSEKMYKTGDIARFLPDGAIEYMGRIDHQVKLRGFRIEPGEVENKIMECFPVSNCTVTVREDSPGDQRLVAYTVSEQALPDIGLIKNELSKHIPDFMIPSAFISLDSIPVTANGKLDKKALPGLETNNERKNEFLAPRNETENTLAEIWTEILNLDVVGIRDNFFDLGGHSLLATQIVSRIRDEFGIEVPLSALFEKPTIENTALFILENEIESVDDETLARLLNEMDEEDKHNSAKFE